MRKLKFKDFYPNDDNEVIETIKIYLGSSKKVILDNINEHLTMIKNELAENNYYGKN